MRIGSPARPLPAGWWEGLSARQIARVIHVEMRGEPRVMPARHYKGYVRLYLGRGHPYADSSGCSTLHRWVKQRELGVRLDPDIHVHHRNGDKETRDPAMLDTIGNRLHGKWHYWINMRRIDGRLRFVDCGCREADTIADGEWLEAAP